MSFGNRFMLGAVAALVLALVASVAAGARGPSADTDPRADAAGAAGKQTTRYQGRSKSGQPISFLLVSKGGKTRVKGLAVDVVTECWADQNSDGVPDKIVAHITKLQGSVSSEGGVEVYFAPDDDTEYVVQGEISKGRARLNVVVGGRFGPDGIPNAGSLECDNWGTVYKAKKRY